MASNPWEIQPQLTLPRLQLVEKLLRDVRHASLRLHDPLGGDDNWSLGCRIYARSRNTLAQMESQWEWLRIVKDQQQFIFAIGGVPVRFYRGDSESPPAHNLELAPEEMQQMELCYGRENPFDLIWRVAIETNNVGEVLRIVLIGAHTEGGVDVRFVIPPDDTLAIFVSPPVPVKRGVTLPPPTVTVLTPKRASDTEQNDDSGPKI
jgi:hypothetical protein